MSDDRIDRLEGLIETLVTTITRGHDDLVQLARINAAEHAEFRREMARFAVEHREYRADIKRLYDAWPDHLRDSHDGGQS